MPVIFRLNDLPPREWWADMPSESWAACGASAPVLQPAPVEGEFIASLWIREPFSPSPPLPVETGVLNDGRGRFVFGAAPFQGMAMVVQRLFPGADAPRFVFRTGPLEVSVEERESGLARRCASFTPFWAIGEGGVLRLSANDLRPTSSSNEDGLSLPAPSSLDLLSPPGEIRVRGTADHVWSGGWTYDIRFAPKPTVHPTDRRRILELDLTHTIVTPTAAQGPAGAAIGSALGMLIAGRLHDSLQEAVNDAIDQQNPYLAVASDQRTASVATVEFLLPTTNSPSVLELRLTVGALDEDCSRNAAIWNCVADHLTPVFEGWAGGFQPNPHLAGSPAVASGARGLIDALLAADRSTAAEIACSLADPTDEAWRRRALQLVAKTAGLERVGRLIGRESRRQIGSSRDGDAGRDDSHDRSSRL